jgi:SNF2 family DNA or RNA helicase
MIKFVVYNGEFRFSIIDDVGLVLNTSDWNIVKSTYPSELTILKTFHENGLASFGEKTLNVGIEEILSLNQIERKILGLPDNYPYEVVIDFNHNGTGVADLNSSFEISFYDYHPHGNKLESNLNLPFVEVNNHSYLLNFSQFDLIKSVDQYNSLDKSLLNHSTQWTFFSTIKELSTDISINLDTLLERENFLVKNKIKLNIDLAENGDLKIFPDLENDFQPNFKNQFNAGSEVKKIYSLTSKNKERLRLTFEDDPTAVGQKSLKSLLNSVKDKSVFQGEEINTLIENPEVFLDADYFDIDAFSDRVRELGLYKPKFYQFITPYRSEWIPGVIIKDPILGETKITFTEKVDLEEFIKEINIAKANNQELVEWKSTSIPIKTAEEISKTASNQFKNPQKPNQNESKKEIEINGEKVLIIYENVEQLDFSNTQKLTLSDFEFEKTSNLNSNISLKKHQIEGISWMQTLFKAKAPGCLLADDMGLGKTLQIIYFIEWFIQNNPESNKPILIVSPVSLLENWQNEYNKFFGKSSFPIKILFDNHRLSKTYNSNSISELQKRQIIITNYETIRSYQLNICAVDFSVVVLDEAQKVKTPGTYITNACKALKADFKIAMTGTPIENTFVDIWCLMDFCAPGYLGNAKEFEREFQKPLNRVETDIKALGESLRNRIGLYLKRRLKEDIKADLPSKFDSSNINDQKYFESTQNFKIEMPAVQFEIYKEALNETKSNNLTGVAKTNRILQTIQSIKTISDHPYLLNRQITNYSAEELVSSSAKLQVVIDIINSIKSKQEKCIIFAERRDTQQMLRKVIYGYFEISPSIINGDTPSKPGNKDQNKSRQETIDYFQSERGFNVIILSPLAAGVGLNVVGANHVIHYSRHWNPAKEDQATDRAYRIGQEKDVYVYYPMAIFPSEQIDNTKEIKSFDEVLDSLLRRKKTLANSTLYPSEAMELNQDEVFSELFFEAPLNPVSLTIKDLDNLNPDMFEAAIGQLFYNNNQVQLTPNSNDKGVDIVVRGHGRNLLIQAKQSKNIVGSEGVQEVVAGLNYYKQIFLEDFKLIVVTNSDFSGNAKELAVANNVELIHREKLKDLIASADLKEKDLVLLNNSRLLKI